MPRTAATAINVFFKKRSPCPQHSRNGQCIKFQIWKLLGGPDASTGSAESREGLPTGAEGWGHRSGPSVDNLRQLQPSRDYVYGLIFDKEKPF